MRTLWPRLASISANGAPISGPRDVMGSYFSEADAQTALDRMIAARFEIPVTELNRRRRFRLRMEDVDGAVSELTESNR